MKSERYVMMDGENDDDDDNKVSPMKWRSESEGG